MSNQTSYNLDLTGSQIEERLNKVPEIEKESISLNAKVESLKQDIPTKTSDLTNDMDFVTSQELEEVEAIAKGRASGHVFDTVEDMNIWLSNTNNVVQLKLGDNLYIRAVDVPDYWWDGSQAQELETQKVDLSEYVTQEEFDDKTIQPDWNQKDESAPDYIKNKPDDIEHTSYKVQPWSQLESYSEKHYPSMYMLEEMIGQKFSGVDSDIVVLKMDKENLSNKVSLISNDSTHDQYPSAKAVADYFKYMQDSGSNDIYIDDNVYILDKYVPFDELSDHPCFIWKNEDGSWSANEDGFYVNNNMRIGETYRIMSCLIDMEFTLTEDDWDGAYLKYYSDDLKSELWLTGVYITTEEAAEYYGEDIGTFLGVMGYIYYDSDIGEDVFGTPIDEIPWEYDEWAGTYYVQNDTITIEYFEPQKVDYRHLPEDIATQDMITATQNMIPQNTESIENKIQSFEEMDENSDSQYPSAKAVVDFSDKKENRSNKLKKLINSVTHTSYPSSRAVMDYVKNTNGDWELLEETTDIHYVFDNTGENWCVSNGDNIVIPVLEFNKTYTLLTEVASVEFNLGNYTDFPNSWTLNLDIDGGKVYLQIMGYPGYWDNEIGDFVYDGVMYDALISMTYYADTDEEIPLINGASLEFFDGYAVAVGTASVGYYTPKKIDKERLPSDVEYTGNKTNNWIDPTDDKYPTAKLVDSRFNECEKYTTDAYTAAQNAETLADDAKIAVDIVRERESMFAMITTSNANKIPLVFDTSKKTLTIYGDANTYVRVNKNLQYQFSSSQTIDLAYGNGYIVFDFSTNKFVLKPNNASSKASDGQALIAVYSNYGQSVSSHMKYSIDGHIYGINLDPMRETIEPEYEWLNIGARYWSDFFIHDDILYVFIQSKYEDWSENADNADGRIYLFDLSDLSTPKLTLKHNFGHCNTVHYCEQTDKLLIGNLPGNDTYKSALYIIDNISGWKSLANNSFLDFNTIDKTIVDISGLKTIISTNDNIGNVAACWGANNIDRYDAVWCSTNYNTHWFKLLLGIGANDLSLLENGGGVYNEVDENTFNGTFLMLEHYKFDIPNSANTEVIQGMDYANGKVYTANGHNHMLGWVWDFSGGTVQRKTIKNTVQYPDGSIYSAISEGFCIYNGYAYHGYQEAQENSTWNDYPANPGTRLSGIMKYELALASGDASGGGIDKKYVDDSIQSAILDSWEVAV